MNKKWLNFLLCIVVGVIIWFSPVPEGIDLTAWHLLAIFVATILGFILQPFSIGIVTFLAITLSVLFGVLKPAQALSGFSSTVVWLIISAFLFSRGFIKSGLGRRIAFMLMNKFGDSSLKTCLYISLQQSDRKSGNSVEYSALWRDYVSYC